RPRHVKIEYLEGGVPRSQVFDQIEGKELKIVADVTKHPAWALKLKLAALQKEAALAKTAPNQIDAADYSKNAPKVNYGDVIRLTYFPGEKVENGITLHSHALNYDGTTSKSTSGQQQVTGMAGEDDNDWWMIASPTKELSEVRDTVVKSGNRIMLIHLSTNKCLHSHTNVINDTNGWDNTLKAPDNEHREITCFNTDKNNIGNSWLVKIYEGKAPVADGSDWIANKNVVLERYNPNLGNPDYKTDYPEYLWISDKLFGTHQQHIVGLNKTPTYFVVEDIKNKPGYVYGKFIVEIPVNLPEKWFAEDGKFSAIAVGSTSTGKMLKFGIGMDGKLYEFNNNSMSDNAWEEFESINDTAKQPIGQLISLTISADGNMLVINSDNKVFEFDFTKKIWAEIKTKDQPKLTQISCGNDKTIVAKSADNKIYKLEAKEWVEISDEGEMVVATVKSNIFGLGLNGNVYKYTSEEDWTELATATTPFVYIAAADTVEHKIKATDVAKKSSTKSTTKATTKAKTTKTITETVEKTIIFAVDKDFALWKLVLGETKWTPVLGKDGKPSVGLSKIVTNGVSHVALDGENDNYHFGESGIKISADKKVEKVKPVTKTRTQAIKTGKLTTKAATKVTAKKSIKVKSNVKKGNSKNKLTKTKLTKNKKVTKKPAKKPAVKKQKVAKKTSQKATRETANQKKAVKKAAGKTAPVASTTAGTPAA
ncbi:MAG: tectonin domain-containing protein, partial [Candidatus Babeliales bacterium]